jgi:hypothetical protein
MSPGISCLAPSLSASGTKTVRRLSAPRRFHPFVVMLLQDSSFPKRNLRNLRNLRITL